MDFDNKLETITPTKSTSLTINGTGALFIPAGTVGERPVAPQSGYIRFNTSDTVLEYYNGVAVQWQTFGSSTLNSLLSVSGTGLLVQTSPGVYAARSIAGTTNRVTVTNGDGVSGNPTLDISSAYVGQTSITTLGTVGTGVWQGTTVGITFGGTGLSTLGTANQILGVNTGATGLEYKTLTAGANITITPSAGALTIASTGGSATPGGATTNVQFNNAGAFGGTANFNYVGGANPQVNCVGTAATTQFAVGSLTPSNTNVTTGSNNATLYIEVPADTQSEGLRVHFKRSAAGISGWITYDYDVNTPNIRLTDEDDDPPYIQFNTIGSGTYLLPQYTSLFGARGPYAGRTTGFEWKIGTATADWGAATSVMLMDSQFLTLPGGSFNGAAATGTTANRPGTPAAGMSRYNNDLGSVEVYEANTWCQLTGIVARSTTSTATTVVGPTNIVSYSVPGGLLGTNRLLRINLNGIWNNASGATRTVTVAVSYGGTVLWQDTSATLATGATLPWNMNFVLSANNSATSQRLGGVVTLGSTNAATTGNGDLATDEITGITPVRGTAAVNSAAAQTLNVAVTFSGATITWTTDYYTIEAL